MSGPTTCDNCHAVPARMLLPDTRRYLCGVCAHRLKVLRWVKVVTR